MVCAVFVLIVFALGFPASIFGVLYHFETSVGANNIQFLLGGCGVLCRYIRLLISVCSVGYDSDRCPWWEAVIMIRKFALMCIVVFASDLFVQGDSSFFYLSSVVLYYVCLQCL
jgi:hypothetical protein